MPLNPSIPLGVQQVKMPDQLQTLAQLYAVKGAQQQNALADYQLGQAQQKDARDNALRSAIQGAVGPDGAIDMDKVGAAYAQNGDAAGMLGFQTARSKIAANEATASTQRLERASKTLGFIGQLAQGVTDQRSYDAAKAQMAQVLGPQMLQGMPEIYDPKWVDQQKQSTLSYKDQIDLQLRSQAQQQTANYQNQELSLKRREQDPAYIQQSEAAKARGQMEGMIGTPGAPIAPGGAAATATGDEFLQTLDPQTAATVKALAEGRMQMPSGFALQKPYWQGMMRVLSQYDPNFDMVNYQARASTRKFFTSGQGAQNATAINTAVAHLGALKDAYDKLGNSSIPGYNVVANKIGQATGNEDIQKNYADVATRAEAVSHELAKVFRQSGMSEGEINAWKERVDPNAAPGSQRGVIGSALELMRGRLSALSDQYSKGMGTTREGRDFLTPEAQKTFDALENYASGDQAQAAQTAPAATNARGWSLHMDRNGNYAYVSPDGKQFEEVRR